MSLNKKQFLIHNIVLFWLCNIVESSKWSRTMENRNRYDQETPGTEVYVDYFDPSEMVRIVPTLNGPIARLKECSEKMEKICCEGYVENPYNKVFCLPICRTGCPNGFCAAPDRCECRVGYVRTLNGDCVPTCPRSCLNGWCIGTDECSCKHGYFLHFTGKFCVPKCPPGCGLNGNCTVPFQCGCVAGYEYLSGECQPICDPPCYNGQCVRPNVCSCHAGYQRIGNSTSCEARCWQDCQNGICIQPNVCQCKPGYLLNLRTWKCSPFCHGCEKGTCVDIDRCLCPDGYAYDGNTCVFNCKEGCPNGRCIGPNMCLCQPGYRKSLISGKCERHARRNRGDIY